MSALKVFVKDYFRNFFKLLSLKIKNKKIKTVQKISSFFHKIFKKLIPKPMLWTSA